MFLMRLLIVLLAMAETALAIPSSPAIDSMILPKPTVKADALITSNLAKIDKLLQEKNLVGAVQAAITTFGINASNCRAVQTRPIQTHDELGNEIVGQTRLDQVIALDPNQIVFKSARFLVSILAHEVTHCDQNQKMFAMAMASDPALAPLREKVTLLRDMADLDDLASLATKDNPQKAAAAEQFKALAAKHGLDLAPDKLIPLSLRVIEDVSIYKRTLADLQEMEAALRAFELPGVIPPPSGKEKPSPEFAFQYNYLMLSTNKLLRARAMLGAQGPTVCRMGNFVPFEMTMQQERTCTESVRLLQTFLPRMQG
jgi:hypothetical protein